MTQSDNSPLKNQVLNVLLASILFLFFFQLITEFVEAIYLFGLLGSSIPPEIAMVLFLLSPVLLFAFRGKISPPWLKILAVLVLLARAVEIFLPTPGRMFVSGIGVAAWLMFFPGMLSLPRTQLNQRRFAREDGAALVLGLFAFILARGLNSGSDLFAYGMFRMVSLILALVGLYLLWQIPVLPGNEPSVTNVRKSRVYAYGLGITSVIILIYFALTAPNVISRWVSIPYYPVFGLVLLAWIGVGWWWMRREDVSPKVLIAWGLIFAVAMLLTILPHQVKFPSSLNGGYPLLEPQIATWQYIPLYLMLLLSPVLLLLFVTYLDGILAERPKLSTLAGAFSVAGFYLLVMILSQVFTTVYDYIPVIGPFFRDKFWLVFLIPSLGAALPALLLPKSAEASTVFTTAARRMWLGITIVLAILTLGGLFWRTSSPSPPAQADDTLRVFTYNIRQGYDDAGERNFDGQLALIRSMQPDIIGLQECDPARIAGGNADIVAYFADRLDMYSYYGPSPVAGTFGDALLSRYPIENPRTFYLFSEGEQVAVVEADITVGDQTFKIYVTHLGNGGPIFQIRQMLDLMRGQTNVVAMGDFNFRHYEEQYNLAIAEFDDAYVHAETQNIPSDFDLEERIDHVFVSPGMQVLYVEYLIQPESDHPGLFVELGW